MKVAINRCFGIFGLSNEAMNMFEETTGNDFISWSDSCHLHEVRTNPDIILIIETLRDKASGSNSCIVVLEIPDNATDWRIENYDGCETLWYVIDGKMKMK